MHDFSVLILCGGQGKRLRPKYTLVPKVLVPVRGEPMLSHILTYLERQGFNDFVFATGYLSEQIEEFLRDRKPRLGAKVSNAGVEAGMMRRLFAAQEHCRETVVVVYGDTLVNLNYHDLIVHHIKSGAEVTAVVGKIRNPFGVVGWEPSEMRITAFEEKPVFHYYIGCFVFQKSVLDRIPKQCFEMPDGQGLVAFFKEWVARGRLHGYEHAGLQITFNSVSELEDAERALNEYYTLKES
jgi:NDP-sugar pyrophosphorylase family protein